AARMPSAVLESTSRRVRDASPCSVTAGPAFETDETMIPAPFAPLTGAFVQLYTRYAEYQRRLFRVCGLWAPNRSLLVHGRGGRRGESGESPVGGRLFKRARRTQGHYK